ncbi:hypothetical protein YN1_1070 [Nanoarchaeota archaeon]
MILRFFLYIPEKYVNLEISNNYRQKTLRIKDNKFKIISRDTPIKIIKFLERKKLDFEIKIKELENVKYLIETYDDLFHILKDFISAKIENEGYKKGISPLWEYYNSMWDNQCGVRNSLFSKYLKELGLETRLVAGIYLMNLEEYPRTLKATHVWTEVKIDNKWIEVDASQYIYPTFNVIRLNYLNEWNKFERDFWLKNKVEIKIL